MSEFLTEYFDGFQDQLSAIIKDPQNQTNLEKAVDIFKDTKKNDKTIFLIGNGGSAAIAEHMAVDLTKNAKLKARSISGAPLLTTFSNDYGYEKVFEKAIEFYGNEGDVLIAISSSGASKNILNACAMAKQKGMAIITLSGFEKNNLLSKEGEINFYVDSKSYGFVEIIHNLLIHYINDAVIGKIEYKSS
ncbi:MAG: SIS domain-containing protein [Candidatus Omnitrophica bacterium]|nr:SIS domain-containing protein [Candidatus Omnitrophota bacterium]